jgi:hypothetical protein
MTPQRHALLARQLIERCGGLCAAAEATRLEKSRLSDFQNPNIPGASMPADVICDLEAYCGEPIYSRALFEARPYRPDAIDAITEACEATEAAAELQRLVRTAAADGTLSEADRRRIHNKIEELLEEARALALATEAPQLRVVGGEGGK